MSGVGSDLVPVVVSGEALAGLAAVCGERGTAVESVLAFVGLRPARGGVTDGQGRFVGGPDDGALGMEEDELLLCLGHLHLLRALTGSEVLGLWRAFEMPGCLRPWLAGVSGVHGPVVESAAAVVAYLGDLALGRDLVRLCRGRTDREVRTVLSDAGVTGAEWALLRFEHGLPENAVALRTACEAQRAGAGAGTNPFTSAQCPVPSAFPDGKGGGA